MSSLFSDPLVTLVADASAVINLNATLRAAEIIRLTPHRFVVTQNAVAELERGLAFGHADATKFEELSIAGLVHRAELGELGTQVYESLVSGTTLRTLDDGEAATIGYALEISAVTLIDEKKARSICASHYPSLEVISTVELLFDQRIAQALGEGGLADALFAAMQGARMRVLPEYYARVVALLGKERASLCSSLPRSALQ